MDGAVITYNEKDSNLFSSGTIWFFTCVFVAIFPIFLSYIYESLSQHELADITSYLKDILLIALSISCSVLVLSLDRSKIISSSYRKTAIIMAGFSALISASYYFYLSGIISHSEQPVYGKNFMTCLSLLFIIFCTIIGCLSQRNHDCILRSSASTDAF